MRLVAAALPPEVHRRVARIVVRGRRRAFLGPEALETGGGLDQGPVHAEVFIRQQPLPVGRPHHLVEQGPAHVVCHQPLPVLGEDGRVEAALHQVHVQEPAVEQVVLEFLAEGALAAHRVEGDQQRGLQQALGRDGGPTHTGIHAVELRRQPIGHGLDPLQRMVLRDPFPGSTMASMLRWGLGRPRIGECLRSWMPRFLTSRVFPQPASG